MKLCIVTRSDGRIKEMTDITHPILKRYAKKCGAEFKILSDSKGLHPHYRILQLYELFKVYDRILCIDSDVLIMKSCPNIFKLVPIEKIGCIYEDKGSRQEDRRNRIAKIQREREDIGWETGYINTGVIVFSRLHRDIFKNENLYLDLGYDDVLLGYKLNKQGYEIHELPFTFNHMSMHSEDWNKHASRFDSYIIHFAGRAFYPQIDRTEQIGSDFLILKKYGYI